MVNSLAAFAHSQFFDELKHKKTNLPLFEGPITYDTPLLASFNHAKILLQAKKQALLDWNRNLHSYCVNNVLTLNTEPKSVYKLRDGKPFESINDLYAFIKKHLLVGINANEHEKILEQSILHLHHGGIIHAAGIAISKRLLKGLAHPTPTFSFKINLYPLLNGIGIEESLTLKSIAMPNSDTLVADELPEIEFKIKHFSSLEKNSTAGTIEANSLTTNVTCSAKAQVILDINPSDILNNSSSKQSLTSLLNFFNWPLNLLLSQLGFVSEIDPENINREHNWLKALTETSEDISSKIESQQKTIDTNKKNTYIAHQLLNRTLKPLSQLNLKTTAKQQELIAFYLKSLNSLKKSFSEIIYSQTQKNIYIKKLNGYILNLTKEQLDLSSKINQLKHYQQASYLNLRKLPLSITIDKLQARILKLDLSLNNSHQLLNIFKIEDNSYDIYLKPYNSMLNKNIKIFKDLKQEYQALKKDKVILEKNRTNITNILERYDKHSTNNHAQINAKKLNSNDLIKSLLNLKRNFKKLINNNGYIKYLHQKDLTIAMYHLFEKIYKNEVENINCQNIDSVIQDIKEMPHEIDALFKIKLKIEEHFIKLNDDLYDRFNKLNKLLQYYKKPEQLFEKTVQEPKVEEAFKQAKTEVFNSIKQTVLKKINKYSHPSLGWFITGQWGKQNANRASTFCQVIQSTIDIASLLQKLQTEYIITQKIVKNEDGDYRNTLAETIKYVSGFIINSQRSPYVTLLTL